jgi:hypothetical protein
MMESELKEVAYLWAGLVPGVFSSWAFWRYLLLLKPKIRISPQVLKGLHPSFPGATVYRIKIINESYRQVIGLEAHARIQTFCGKHWINLHDTKLRYNTHCLGGKHTLNDRWGIQPTFSFLLIDEENLEAKLSEDARLVFAVSATDALSGTTVVLRQTYRARDVRTGNFEHGLSFAIEDTPMEMPVGSADDERSGRNAEAPLVMCFQEVS